MPVRGDPLFTFRPLPLVADLLLGRGHDPRALLDAAGLADANPRAELTAPLTRLIRFIDAAAEVLREPLFGLVIAEAAASATFGFPVFAARTAPDVRIGLQALCELAALLNPIGRFTLIDDQPFASLEYAVAGSRGGLGRHLNEYTLWLIVRICADGIVGGLPLERVWLPHERDRGTAAMLQARVGCPVELGAPTVGFAFRAELLSALPRAADPALFAFLVEQARNQLAVLPPEDTIAQLIRVIEPRLADSPLGLRRVAKLLAITERSLQRRLVAAGTSYREVLDHVRHRRFRQLRRAGVTWEAAAEQLGFADTRGLRRAAARWDVELS